MTATLPAADPAAPPADPGDFEHAFCCNPARAVCGVELREGSEISRDEVINPCPICEAIEAMGSPCEAEGCTR